MSIYVIMFKYIRVLNRQKKIKIFFSCGFTCQMKNENNFYMNILSVGTFASWKIMCVLVLKIDSYIQETIYVEY